MKTSSATITIIAEDYEKFRAQLYNDATNNATIGYGKLVHFGPINGSEPEEFKAGITRERALEILAQDVAWAEHCVSHYVKAPLNQNQFDALVSLTFNAGSQIFVHDHQDTPIRKLLSAGKYDEVPAHILLYDRSQGKRLAGLTKRRIWEARLFQQAV